MKYCTNCGNKLEEGQQVCLNCGSIVDYTKNPKSKETGGKSKIAAGLLGIFLGFVGVHNFYLGYTGKAIGQLLLTVLSCGVLFLVFGD